MYTKKVLNGYYMTTQTYDARLQYCPNVSAGVNFRDGVTVLRSYCTDVIEISAGGWLVCSGTYSRTTIKHISAFLKEYAPDVTYYDVKQIAGRAEALNIYTGDIISMETGEILKEGKTA